MTQAEKQTKFQALVDVMTRLRDPENGCPWDKEQTHETLKPFLIEEAYEVIEAIESGDQSELRGELGDLLLQVLFHAQLAKERGDFTIEEVIEAIHSKMIRRHPHVFGDENAENAQEVLRNWEAIKAAERQAAGQAEKNGAAPASILDSVSSRIPALIEAAQLTERAARVGFDWPELSGVMAKVREETLEIEEAASQQNPNADKLEDEMGDLLFAAVNLARWLKVEPESALRRANRKFKRRFRQVELGLQRQGKTPSDSALAEMDALWDEAKRLES